MHTMVQKEGSLLSSMSGWLATCSGTGIWNFLPDMLPQIGPATIIDTMPQQMPTMMTQPNSTFSMVATNTGPGVGGMKA